MILAFQGQSLDEHVAKMLKEWERIKKRYLKTIQRSLKSLNVKLSEEQVDEFVKTLIKLHDIGKASRIYQRHIKKGEKLEGFRHELVSAYYTYPILKEKFNEKVAFVGSLVVMLHHEPILMGQITSIEKKGLTAEVVLDKLRKFDGMVEETKEWLTENVGIVVEEPKGEDLIRFVFELSVRARHMPDSGKLRLIAGALLIPLVLCDYAGARDREGEAPKFAEVLGVEEYGI
ncbi:MAG TPA: CRISPR-associated endonuclease Cas3'' [Thermococcus paralvinellae]|uniref:CRISPR-associated endonuclease Cas3 n=1 Tax=Thermococcus paralvinellae TaxID=582419 RepID=A0A832Z9S7_9EURY|nr:CRISPR-associated endonuclease Cas3'' [Thermococcus paralvinellae]